MFKNLKLGIKLNGAFIAVAGLTFVLGALAIFNMSRVKTVAQRLDEIEQQSGITHAQVLDAMRREVAEAHDELAAEAPPEGFDQTHGLTASRISLLGHDDLEIDIRIGDIASHLRDDERIDHWRVQLRYMTLLQRPEHA